jgi:post-segregation antitoxin (ccd killing protein)
VPKVNIYLSDDLAAEVRAAKLSLSPVCQRAIREELGKMQAKQAVTSDLEAVAARLRGTIDEDEREQRKEGHDDGVQWAREYATAAELRLIVGEDFEEDVDRDTFPSLCDFKGDQEHSYFVGVHLHVQDAPYWDGFVAGASEVLAAVEPLLAEG